MVKQLTCIVVDDEPVAIKIVTSLVNKTNFLKLIGGFQDSVEGANAIAEHQPDIIFLDVQMPEVSGFDIIKSLSKRPEIILITSNKDYAIDAFEFKVTDYLLKPIDSYSRFLQAAQRAKDNIIESGHSKTPDQSRGSIFMKIDSLLTKINFEDIYFIEAYGDYIKVHTASKIHTVYSKLKVIEEQLPGSQFMRVHRSYIVQIAKINNIDQKSIEINGAIIPVSTSYKSVLMENIRIL